MQKVNREYELDRAALNDAINNDKVIIPYISQLGTSAFQIGRLADERGQKK